MRVTPARNAPPLPFRVLSGLLLVGAVSGLVFVLLPSDRPDLQRLDLYGAGAYTVMALIVWFLLPRIAHQWGLDIAILITTLSTFAAVAFVDLMEGRVLTGFALVLFAMFCAYFLPVWRYVSVLALMSLAYGFAVMAVGKSMPVSYYFVIILITAATSGFVAVLVRQLRAQATTDQLTGVLNRHGMQLATGHLDRSRPTTVAIIDIDGFKTYNDEHGHLAGDQYLIEVAGLLKERLRSTDVLARFGGDEFVVVLPDCPSQQECMGALSRAPSAYSWTVGAAMWSPTTTFDEALAVADARLYDAKSK